MIINQEKISYEEFPRFWCPNCHKGILKIIKGSEIRKHPSKIRLLPDEPNIYTDENGNEQRDICFYDIEGTEYEEFITTFFLECDRDKCKEVISTCGLLRIETIIEPDENGEEANYNEEIFFYPKHFYPSIRLFVIPENTPKLIIDELETAFSLFWSNPPSCGNSIRKVIERMIDEIDQPPKKRISLHDRIMKLDSKYSEIKDFLFATKFIGNDGSHQSDLIHDDVILAFEFVEKCLIELYKNEKKDLNSIARKINKNKKPISKIEK